MKEDKCDIAIKEMPQMQVAAITHTGPYAGDEQLFAGLFTRLFAWAGPKGFINFPQTKAICIYHDDPKTTPPQKLRTSVCVSVPAGSKGEGEIKVMTLSGGRYLVGRFELLPHEFAAAWGQVMASPLSSGAFPDERHPYELYHNNCQEHPEKKSIVDICVPVK